MNWKIWLIHKLGGYSENEFDKIIKEKDREIDKLCDCLKETYIEQAHVIELQGVRHVTNDEIKENMEQFKLEIAADISEEMLKHNVIKIVLTPPKDEQYFSTLTGTVRCLENKA